MKIRTVKPRAHSYMNPPLDEFYYKSDTKEVDIDEMAKRVGNKLSGLPTKFINPLEIYIKEAIEQFLQEQIE